MGKAGGSPTVNWYKNIVKIQARHFDGLNPAAENINGYGWGTESLWAPKEISWSVLLIWSTNHHPLGFTSILHRTRELSSQILYCCSMKVQLYGGKYLREVQRLRNKFLWAQAIKAIRFRRLRRFALIKVFLDLIQWVQEKYWFELLVFHILRIFQHAFLFTEIMVCWYFFFHRTMGLLKYCWNSIKPFAAPPISTLTSVFCDRISPQQGTIKRCRNTT